MKIHEISFNYENSKIIVDANGRRADRDTMEKNLKKLLLITTLEEDA